MIFDYTMLYKAWRETVTLSSEEPNRARFKFFLEENLSLLLDELNNQTFKPTPLRIKQILYPKRREAQVPAIRDKIVQHSICDNYLYDVCTKPLIKECTACIVGRGDLYASNVVKEQMVKYRNKYGTDFYVLKCDIHHYFQSIPHKRVYELLDRYCKDEDANRIAKQFVDLNCNGLSLGLQQSQILANLFLSELDHKCKEVLRAEFYCRHMDDFYIISNSTEYLNFCYQFIKDYVEGIGLSLNPKTAIVHNRFSFLGFTYFYSNTGKIIKRLDRSKKNAKHRQIRKMLKELENGEMTIEHFATSYQGWRSHALQGDCGALVSAYDRWLVGEVGRLGYGLEIRKRRVKGYADKRT